MYTAQVNYGKHIAHGDANTDHQAIILALSKLGIKIEDNSKAIITVAYGSTRQYTNTLAQYLTAIS